MQGVKTVLGELELSLNENKTRVMNAKEESFTFLGFSVEVKRSPKSGKLFPLIQPSKKALKRIKVEIKTQTSRVAHGTPTEIVIQKLNETVRGWVGYYYYGNCTKSLNTLKWYLEERMRTYCNPCHYFTT